MNKISTFSKITIYIKHITFIGFLFSGIILYTDFIKSYLGIMCFVFFMIYSIVTFILFFIKNKTENSHSINNLVVSFLHCYLMLVAYRYYSNAGADLFSNDFFNINYIMISIAMLTLTINKLLICNIK